MSLSFFATALLLLPQGPQVATPEAVAQDSVTLQRALASVDEPSVRADLDFLTSEALGGRGTPSPELRLASLYLRTRLQRMGLEPGGEEGTWFHHYGIARRSLDIAASSVSVQAASGEGEALNWRFGRDLWVSGPSELRTLDLSGGVVCIGTGKDVDLDPLPLEGKFVLVLDEGRVRRRLLRQIEKAGALGLIIAPGNGYDRDPYAERFEGALAGRFMPQSRFEALQEPGMPRVYLGQGRLEQLLSLARKSETGEPTMPLVGEELAVLWHEQRIGDFEKLPERNVGAFLPGSDPVLAQEVIVLSAHYDHLGRSEEGYFPGADDNASGTSGLLAVAQALATRGPLKRSVLMLWFSGEERGLWGSEAWTKAPVLPNSGRAVCNINIDMIGRTGSEELYITPSLDHSFFNALAQRAYDVAPLEGFPKLESQDEYWSASDHFNFARQLEIQTVFLSTGDHDDYHKRSDTADKIDVPKLMRVARLTLRIMEGLQEPGIFDAVEPR